MYKDLVNYYKAILNKAPKLLLSQKKTVKQIKVYTPYKFYFKRKVQDYYCFYKIATTIRLKQGKAKIVFDSFEAIKTPEFLRENLCYINQADLSNTKMTYSY